jgi:hypothetical protein
MRRHIVVREADHPQEADTASLAHEAQDPVRRQHFYLEPALGGLAVGVFWTPSPVWLGRHRMTAGGAGRSHWAVLLHLKVVS